MSRYFIILMIIWRTNLLFGQYHAVYIPEDKLREIKIDADTSDWEWVPNRYIITEKSMRNNFGKKISGNKWNCRIKVGWSDQTNRIYFIVKVTDDIISLNNPLHFLNDCFQFVTNSKNNVGLFRHQTDKSNLILGFFVSDTINTIDPYFLFGPKWIKDPEIKSVDWGVKNFKNESNEYVTIYEVSIMLIDKWIDESPVESEFCELEPGKNIRLNFMLHDIDGPDNPVNTDWTSRSGDQWYEDATKYSEFTLDPPLPTKGISWHNINYILNIK